MARSAGTAGKKRITFTIDAPSAAEVILVGDFNGWDTSKHLMKPGKNGSWTRTVMLAPGHHEYKFVVDGEWITDPRHQDLVHNDQGTMNSTLDV